MRNIDWSSKVLEGLRLARGPSQVPPEWLFHHDTGAHRATALAELLDDRLKKDGWNREIEHRTLCGAELFADSLECGRVVVIARNISQQAGRACRKRPDRVCCGARYCRALGRGADRKSNWTLPRRRRGRSNCRASPSLGARERFSCMPDRPWRQKSRVHRIGKYSYADFRIC